MIDLNVYEFQTNTQEEEKKSYWGGEKRRQKQREGMNTMEK